ncbi:MAG TPA: tRNA (adenosine(37)-N6)-threonylcarbamoyltransferase complex dimerization subunit type 1 TsaB [Anaerolineales bacterium]|nr:tRNA (adenosine(37)-N6)-threonylcarbamoyltransferase complex dimerization subunit type 1 TsaB [Anaerolineales bacterium]
MLLALDTSTRVVGIALYTGVQVLSEALWTSRDYHTVELAPKVEEFLSRAGLQVADLRVLAVALGPGSFTGLRIGLALAKGLCLAQHLPLIGIPSLDILAAALPVIDTQLAAILRAGRGRIVVGWYQAAKGAWQPSGRVEVLTAEGLARQLEVPTQVCGELTEEERRLFGRRHKFARLASPALSLRRPAYLGELAWARWQAGKVDDPATLAPIYLHYNEPAI